MSILLITNIVQRPSPLTEGQRAFGDVLAIVVVYGGRADAFILSRMYVSGFATWTSGSYPAYQLSFKMP